MTYTVIQWATGPVGRSALLHVIDNPDYELVGVFAYSAAKVGLDAGSLVGRPATGVKVTNDRKAILGLEADVVVYAPRMHPDIRHMDDDVLALLRSGKNVVTPAGYWYPPLYGPEYTQAIQAACREGNTTLFGAGENPGFFLPRLAVTLMSTQSEVRSIGLAEMCDLTHSSRELIFDVVGFGKTAEKLEGNSIIAQLVDRCFHEEMGLVANILGTQIDRYERTSRFATLDHDIQLDAGLVKAGTVVAQAHRWSGWRNEAEILSVTNTWFVHRDVPGWDLDDDRWTITIDGRPSMTVDVKPTISLAESPPLTYADTEAGVMETMTAMVVLNAIPRVCAAEAGILYPDTANVPKVRWITDDTNNQLSSSPTWSSVVSQTS